MGRTPAGDPPSLTDDLADLPEGDIRDRPLSAYVHVPYCATRCGYCDFNTYTAVELGAAPGTGQDAYRRALLAEIERASGLLAGAPPLGTVFFGGGTPTLLPADDLNGILAGLEHAFGLAEGCEVTTEANPETLSPDVLEALVRGGFTRLSLGMQSARPHVLATLDRRHTPGRVAQAVRWAREAGFAQVSVDLIYATPGETLDDWRASLESALELGVDHVSAYALIVEDGTRLAARIGRGEISAPDDDLAADMYLAADEMLGAAGLAWYELSNWAKPGAECRHNLAYWRGDNWWGFGPGAHSHVDGLRWWNLAHPSRYSAAVGAGEVPAQAQERLSPEQRRVERVLLESRLASGLPVDVLTSSERERLPGLVGQGLVAAGNPVVLTRRGRLLADAVVRDLLD